MQLNQKIKQTKAKSDPAKEESQPNKNRKEKGKNQKKIFYLRSHGGFSMRL